MAGRSPARFLAPIALVAFAFAFYSVVQNSREPAGGNSGAPAAASPTATAAKSSKKKSTKSSKRKSYTVKAGDTPSGIAEKTGVPLSKILELNPDLDDQSLTVGDKIKLR